MAPNGDNKFRKDKLEEAINTYGIRLDEDTSWDNEKLIKKLGDFFLDLEPEKYSWGARYVQSLNTCMLCEHLKKFIDSIPKNPMESEDWVAETKMNGMRIITYYSPETGFEFFTRRESVSNYLNGNITDKLLFINKGLITTPQEYKNAFNYRFVIDGEILVEGLDNELNTTAISVEDYIQSIFSSGAERAKAFQKDGHAIRIVVFDVLFFQKAEERESISPKFEYEERELIPSALEWVNKHYSKFLESAGFTSIGRAKKLYRYLTTLQNTVKGDVRKYPFSKRRELRKGIVSFLSKKNLPFEEVVGEDTFKVSFLEEILKSGEEGIIVKNLYAPYISDMKSSRGHKAAMKVKQSIANIMKGDSNIMEDFDVFITGANPPKSSRIKDMIGSLKCSVYIKGEDGEVREHEIANISGLSHEWKRKLAQINKETGEISLNPEYEGKVIAINGLALTKSNLKFQHATLKDNGILEFKAKNPSECVWDESTLREMVITRGE